MSNTSLNRILKDPNKCIDETHGVGGVLAALFRIIMRDKKIFPNVWFSYMYDYLRNSKNKIPNNRKDISSIQGNLTKELLRSEMTWKVFCKGLAFLQIVKFEIVIKAKYRNGKTLEHSLPVDLSNANFDEDSNTETIEEN